MSLFLGGTTGVRLCQMMVLSLLRNPYRLVLIICLFFLINVFTLYLLNQNTDKQQDAGCGELNSQLRAQSQLIVHLKSQIESQEKTITQLRTQKTIIVNATNATNAPAQRKPPIHQSSLPMIYMITPTYSRWTQKADLTRLCQTLMHVPNIHWILVEDSDKKTRLVEGLLSGEFTCNVRGTQLNVRTLERMRLREIEPSWRKPRGVEQRNLAIDWLRERARTDELEGVGGAGGVVYFGDDDNTYDLKVFEEMRYTKKVSVWPVGISGGLKFEGPTCRNGRVTGWYSAWAQHRPYQIDMAGFAVNLDLLLSKPSANIDLHAERGFLESSLLAKLLTGMEELEPKADECSKVIVWHTRTEKPKMKHEDQLIAAGRPSNPLMEV